jgi:hypothetical protein
LSVSKHLPEEAGVSRKPLFEVGANNFEDCCGQVLVFPHAKVFAFSNVGVLSVLERDAVQKHRSFLKAIVIVLSGVAIVLEQPSIQDVAFKAAHCFSNVVDGRLVINFVEQNVVHDTENIRFFVF